jgi:hypothetical protein
MSLIKIEPYKDFEFQDWLLDKHVFEDFEYECYDNDKQISSKDFTNMFMDGKLSRELIDEFTVFLQRHFECGTHLFMVISDTDPNLNTRDEAITYVMKNCKECLEYKPTNELPTYEEYLMEDMFGEDMEPEEYLTHGFTNTNPNLCVDIGVLGKYWISIISIPC